MLSATAKALRGHKGTVPTATPTGGYSGLCRRETQADGLQAAQTRVSQEGSCFAVTRSAVPAGVPTATVSRTDTKSRRTSTLAASSREARSSLPAKVGMPCFGDAATASYATVATRCSAVPKARVNLVGTTAVTP